MALPRPRSQSRLARVVVLALCAYLLPSAGAATAFPVTIRDALGRVVTIPRPPARIVSLAPSVTETVFAVGAGSRLVGVTNAETFPPAAKRIAVVGGVTVDLERLAGLHPDLVIGMASLQRAQLEQVIARGFPVVAVDAHTLEETLQAIVLVGTITGRSAAARALAEELRAETARIEWAVADLVRPAVYVELWSQPFVTTGRGTYLHDLLVRAGGRNLFADLAGWPTVSEEQILARAPQVILLTYGRPSAVLQRGAWRAVPAVRARRVYALAPDLVSRPGPRVVEGLRAIARALHPGRVP